MKGKQHEMDATPKESLTGHRRPHFHFTPPANWMNDPNGLVFANGRYHLCYQYNPHGDTWGNMHWGHASSTDLLHWDYHDIAIYPGDADDEFVFSGCCVHDIDNESGLGIGNQGVMLAFYTFSDEKGGRQRQCVSYSHDEGASWIRYSKNPILPNDGRADFRDPKVVWYEAGGCWLMVVAAGQEVVFYHSGDLLHWREVGSFGDRWGNHGGCWECPDLFELPAEHGSRWVLLVSVNPGAPNGGSATQYFVGDFDGGNFVPEHKECRWLDWGPDCFAAVSWEAAKGVKIPRCYIGWMSNWNYAEHLPTSPWRGQMTLPRELSLFSHGEESWLSAEPVALPLGGAVTPVSIRAADRAAQCIAAVEESFVASLSLVSESTNSVLTLRLESKSGEAVALIWCRESSRLLIDRSALRVDRSLSDFNYTYYADLPPDVTDALSLTMVVDRGSIEIFAANGRVAMTALWFANDSMSQLKILAEAGVGRLAGEITSLQWPDTDSGGAVHRTNSP